MESINAIRYAHVTIVVGSGTTHSPFHAFRTGKSTLLLSARTTASIVAVTLAGSDTCMAGDTGESLDMSLTPSRFDALSIPEMSVTTPFHLVVSVAAGSPELTTIVITADDSIDILSDKNCERKG